MIDNTTGSGLSFVKRIYWPRIVGKALGLIAVLAAFTTLTLPDWVWGLVLFNGLVWPHVAYRWASRARIPYKAERRNLLIDSLMTGFWIACMQFNPLPSLTILSMVTMNNVAVGGKRLVAHGMLMQSIGMTLGVACFGLNLQLDVTPYQVYACLPMLTFYPLALGWVSYHLAITLSEHKQRLSVLSRTDSLTGLLNHGAWQNLLKTAFNRCQTKGEYAIIALIDVDHFKPINDTFGHAVGDTVLRLLSQELKGNLRPIDRAGRYGGDEFCVLLREVTEAQAYQIMDRVRQRIASYHDPLLPELRISLSIGLASFRADLASADAWLENADKALYAAKHQGRDQVFTRPVAPQLRLVNPD